jgi:hypothetical protein
MNIKTAVVAGFILNAGLGGAVFAQSGGYYPVQSQRYGNTNQRQAQQIVRQAYRDILRREPDASGLAQYTRSMLYDNWTEADVRRSLQSSQEYAQRGGYGTSGRYGTSGSYRTYENRDIRRSSSNYNGQAAATVRQAYLSTLGREPDAAGLRDYTSRVTRDGWTQRDVERALRSSSEYRNRR